MARSTIDAIRQVEKETLEAEKQAAADARLLSARLKHISTRVLFCALRRSAAGLAGHLCICYDIGQFLNHLFILQPELNLNTSG